MKNNIFLTATAALYLKFSMTDAQRSHLGQRQFSILISLLQLRKFKVKVPYYYHHHYHHHHCDHHQNYQNTQHYQKKSEKLETIKTIKNLRILSKSFFSQFGNLIRHKQIYTRKENKLIFK